MALILRACLLSQRRCRLEEFKRSMICVRNNRNDFKRHATALRVEQFCTKTKEPKQPILLYQGALAKQIRNLKIFSLLTSFAGLVCQPILFTKATESDNMVAVIGVFTFVGLFALATPVLLHLVTKKYVLDIHYDLNKSKYIAKTYSLLVQPKKIEFTPDDVYVPDVPGMFTTCIVKGTPFFIDQQYFKDHSHYIKIMGYDKPIDFKLGNINEQTEIIAENKQTEIRNKR